jgi:hypothetical protein
MAQVAALVRAQKAAAAAARDATFGAFGAGRAAEAARLKRTPAAESLRRSGLEKFRRMLELAVPKDFVRRAMVDAGAHPSDVACVLEGREVPVAVCGRSRAAVAVVDGPGAAEGIPTVDHGAFAPPAVPRVIPPLAAERPAVSPARSSTKRLRRSASYGWTGAA